MAEQYTKSFSSFGGSDILFSINGRVIGEFQSISWKQNKGSSVRGTIHFSLFDRVPVDFEEQGDIFIRYLNEYGQCMLQVLKNAVFTAQVGGANIDMASAEVSYEFMADRLETITYNNHRSPEKIQEMLHYVHSKTERDAFIHQDAYWFTYYAFLQEALKEKLIDQAKMGE